MKVRIRSRALVAICLLMVLCACDKDPVKETAKALNAVAHGNKLVAETVIEANAQGLMSTKDTGATLDVVAKIAEANSRANAVLRTVVGQIAQPTAQQLLAIVDSVLREIATLKKSLAITDEKTRLSVLTAITSVETTVNSVKLLVAAGGQP